MIAKGYAVGKAPITLNIYSYHFVVSDVKRIIKRGVAQTFRHTARRGLPMVLCVYSNNTEVRRNLISLVRVTGADVTVQGRDSTKLLCIPILASPAANNIATDFTVLKSVVLTRPGTLVNFTNPEIVRRAVKRGLPGNFRETRFLLRRNFISGVMGHRRREVMLTSVLELRRGGILGGMRSSGASVGGKFGSSGRRSVGAIRRSGEV